MGVRLFFYVEGQTEQQYVQLVLVPHLARFDVVVMGAVLVASGRRHGRVSRGGGRHYAPMRNDLGRLLKQHDAADVRFTTMFDLYGLYADFPGREEADRVGHLPRERVRLLEQAFAADVGDRRFVPHIQLHEFETILLCEPGHLELVYEDAAAGVAALRAAVADAGSAELVNDGEATAPSKRIARHFPAYGREKTAYGAELAHCVGVEVTRRACPHFDEWLTALESLR